MGYAGYERRPPDLRRVSADLVRGAAQGSLLLTSKGSKNGTFLWNYSDLGNFQVFRRLFMAAPHRPPTRWPLCVVVRSFYLCEICKFPPGDVKWRPWMYGGGEGCVCSGLEMNTFRVRRWARPYTNHRDWLMSQETREYCHTLGRPGEGRSRVEGTWTRRCWAEMRTVALVSVYLSDCVVLASLKSVVAWGSC